MINNFSYPIVIFIQVILILSLTACHDHGKSDSPQIIEDVVPDDIVPPIIDNIAPVANQVTIASLTQPNTVISASYTYFDEHDLEGTSLYSWLIDDIVSANSLSFILPSDSEGKDLTFCITPVAATGETTQGAEVCVELIITGKYTKPTIETLVLTNPITTGIQVSASYLFVDEKNRMEGNSLFSWKVNDSEFSTQTTITLPTTQQGNVLILCLTPIALSGENAIGDDTCSDEVTIAAKVGSVPSIDNLQWQTFAKAGNSLTASYDFVDDDGDIESNSTISWSIDNIEVSQMQDFTLPTDSTGKLLSLCVTPIAITGLPTTGTTLCTENDIADIVVTGELELYQTITLAIKGYSYNGVTWRILHPSYSPVRSTDNTSFTIAGFSSTEEANWLIGYDLEICIDTIEEGEICLLASEQATENISGGLPTELDTDNNITKRVIAPVSFIDLTISGVTKRLHRSFNVTESILANANRGGSVPLHDAQYIDVSTSIIWTLYNWPNAVDSCSNQSKTLPIEGETDSSEPFGLHQFYNQTAIDYSQYPGSYITRAMGWPGIYYRSSSFQSAGNHYDYYLVTGNGSYIDDNTAEAAACMSTLP